MDVVLSVYRIGPKSSDVIKAERGKPLFPLSLLELCETARHTEGREGRRIWKKRMLLCNGVDTG